MKCLITGLPEKSLRASFAKLKSVLEKNGPFDGGWFWCWSRWSAHAIEDLEFLRELIKTELNSKLYIVAGETDILAFKTLPTDIRTGLMGVVLEPAGSIKLDNGLTVAFVNGASPGSADISLIGEKQVDLLFTFAWPERIRENIGNGGSPALASLYRDHHMQPRYHFAVSEGVFWEREPFRTEGTVTRFIGLGDGSKADERWHYALNVEPGAPLDFSNARPSPFLRQLEEGEPVQTNYFYNINPSKVPSAKRTAEHLEELRKGAGAKKPPPGYICNHCKSSLHFLRDCPHRSKALSAELSTSGDNRQPPPGYVCHACRQTGHFIRQCPNRRAEASVPVEQCWFCLANPAVRNHLIVEVGDEVYLARPRGAFDKNHLLLVPIEHATRVDQLKEAMRNLAAFEQKLGRLYGSLALVAFRLMRDSNHHWHEQVFAVEEKERFCAFASHFFIKAGYAMAGDRPIVDYFEVIIDDRSLFVLLEKDVFFPSNMPRQMIAAYCGRDESEDWRRTAGKLLPDELEKIEREGVADIKRRLQALSLSSKSE